MPNELYDQAMTDILSDMAAWRLDALAEAHREIEAQKQIISALRADNNCLEVEIRRLRGVEPEDEPAQLATALARLVIWGFAAVVAVRAALWVGARL